MTISHEEHGGKAANLAVIKPLLTELEESTEYGLVGVPEFEAISSRMYERWLNHDLTGAELFELHKHATQLSQHGSGLMVRSSAVLGEDGEKAMGAGIYDSLLLRPGFNTSQLYAAIRSVYRSTQSPKAVAYLEQLGINPNNERMGLVLQTYPNELRSHFTLDTQMIGASALMSVRAGELAFEPASSQPTKLGQVVLNKESLGRDLREAEDAFHLVPDYRKFDMGDASDAAALGKVSLEIENLMNTAVQIEAVSANALESDQESFRNHYNELHPIPRSTSAEEHQAYRERQRAMPDTRTRLWVVQSRPLSYETADAEPFVGFPEDHSKLAYIGRSLGVINGVKVEASPHNASWTVFSDKRIEDIEGLPDSEKHLIVFDGSFAKGETSDMLAEVILQLPPQIRSKIIILVETSSSTSSLSSSGGGHLETMCLELGIPLIFYGQTRSGATDDDLYERVSLRSEMRENNNKFQVYSDGTEARIYSLQ